MSDKIVKVNGIDICSESFGDPSNPAILLIMGATCSMVYWDEEFCQRLADTGRYVIRYDNRDVGRSVVYEPGSSNYTVIDMANDAAGLLDAYNIEQANIVGMSLGGMIAQVLATRHPQKVLTLTLIASSFSNLMIMIGTCLLWMSGSSHSMQMEQHWIGLMRKR